MYTFHAAIHARPATAQQCQPLVLGGCSVTPLEISRDALAAPLDVTFEEAAEALARIERLYVEPDGAFVWPSAAGEPAWQVEGVLYDRNAKLLYVEIKGACPPDAFDRLLAAFGWPRTSLVFQLLRYAVYLDENEFRLWADHNA